jgi:hypothetical protein
MPLQSDATQPGLWFNPEWNPKQPGTFAAIIGVSKYDHLTDDDRSYGLGQLYVSALTAYRFFCWLKTEYRHPDLPLAKVWLLLSPTDAELKQMAGLPKTGYRQPTFNTCNLAIGEWFATMQGLDSMVCEKSRAIFFFSGHGLEVTQDKQILLPSDYLSPPNRNVNMALSTYNLHYGLQALPMPEHFLFLDACRNDNEKLRELMLEGWPVLNPCPSWRAYAKIVSSPIVYAAGSGEAACEPMDPLQGISVFGQALVEGLEDVPGKAMNIGQQYWVTFLELGQYLRERVEKLVEAAGAREKQHVRIAGTAQQAQLCEVGKPLAMRGVIPVILRSLTSVLSAVQPAPFIPDSRSSAIPALSVVAIPPGWNGPADSGDWSQLYNILQNEFITNLLWNARVRDLKTLEWKALKDAVSFNSLEIQRIARTDDKRTYQIDLQLHQNAAQWLEVADDWKKKKAACVLIGDNYLRPRYTLRFDFIDTDQGTLIAGLDVSLASLNEAILGRAAEVWNKYRGVDIGKEASSAEFKLLEEALREKEASPLAATMAALLLLRGRPALLHDWPRNLAEWFSDRPDGCVIWVEQLLRTKQDKGLHEAINSFLELETRGLPHTAEGLGHAARQVKELLDFASPSPADRQRLTLLRERLERVLTVFRPGGFSAVFVGPEEAVSPDLILPA